MFDLGQVSKAKSLRLVFLHFLNCISQISYRSILKLSTKVGVQASPKTFAYTVEWGAHCGSDNSHKMKRYSEINLRVKSETKSNVDKKEAGMTLVIRPTDIEISCRFQLREADTVVWSCSTVTYLWELLGWLSFLLLWHSAGGLTSFWSINWDLKHLFILYIPTKLAAGNNTRLKLFIFIFHLNMYVLYLV